jgi:hypothetical protein
MSFYRTSDFPKWNQFLAEDLLVEGRLQDTMKKYSDIPEFAIKQLSASDPSGKNAYLMWMAKELFHAGAGTYSVPGNAGRYIMDIVPAVAAFHKAKQRISQLNKQRKKEGKALYPNDLNQFKSLGQLDNFLDGLGLSGSEEKRKEKEEALGGATVLQDDDDFFVIRPETTKSSCFFGRDTPWCIAADPNRSQNYFDSYTNQGKSFYFVVNKHLPGRINKIENWREGDNPLAKEGHPGSTYKKIALVFDKNGELDEWFDTPNNSNQDQNELRNILLYNIIAPALAQSGELEYGGSPVQMADVRAGIGDSRYQTEKDWEKIQGARDNDYVDGIAAALRGEDSLIDFLGSDDPDQMNPAEKQIYQNIVSYLKSHGNDLPVNVDELPELGATTLYDAEAAAFIFDDIADQTWSQMYTEALGDTMGNPAGSFSYDDLHEVLQNAGIQRFDVHFEEAEWREGGWEWSAKYVFDMSNSPFNLLQYKNDDFDPDEEEGKYNFKYGDYEDVYGGRYDDEGDVELRVRDAIEGSGIYFDYLSNDEQGEFELRIDPGGDEEPRDGLDGFRRFVSTVKDYDLILPTVEEDIYNALQDHDIAIHPDSIGSDKENWVATLKNLKHLAYDVRSGKMDVYGKAVFEIPNMMKNMRELRKIFPALPEGEIVTTGGAMSDEYRKAFGTQEELLRQLQYYMNLEMKQTGFARRMMLSIGQEINKAQPPGKKYQDKAKQMSIPGTGVKGPADKKPGESYIITSPEVEFMNQHVGFAPQLGLMANIKQGQRDSSELSIGDREIKGAHGIASFGFFSIPIKVLREMEKRNPQEFEGYINGFKYIDENWQDFQDMIGEYVSSQIVPVAKTIKSKELVPLLDLDREDIAKTARDARPRSGLRESKKRRRIRIKIGK